MRSSYLLVFILSLGLFVTSCKHEPPEPVNVGDTANSNYPPDVARIMVLKCATAGCHNDLSYENASNLRLDTWEHLFKGGSTGAAVIPYSTDYSPLLYFINTNPSHGPVATPTMPKDAQALSENEYNIIKNWIGAGAPSREGKIAFADNPATRQKIYLTMQNCDQIGVIDAESRLLMRFISIGVEDKSEVPHCVRFTQDGKYAFVSFTNGSVLQKIDVATDKVINSFDLGPGQWNINFPSPDGSKAIVTNLDGKAVLIDYATGKTAIKQMNSPHGVAADAEFRKFYITGQYGNTLYKVDTFDIFTQVKKISLDGNPPNTLNNINPHEIIMTPDYSKAFLTCEFSNDIRVIDTKTDSLFVGKPAIIPVAKKPQEMAISHSKPYLFVTCMEAPSPKYSTDSVKFMGIVYVINYNTHEVVAAIEGRFSATHGITVDDKNGVFYVASRNISGSPLPHHTSACGGSNGYYHVYSLNDLQPVTVPRRYEVLPDPYSFDTRFK